jgi:hypothetical protein
VLDDERLKQGRRFGKDYFDAFRAPRNGCRKTAGQINWIFGGNSDKR